MKGPFIGFKNFGILFFGQTDGQTDISLMAKTTLHMQRGKQKTVIIRASRSDALPQIYNKWQYALS